MIYDDIDGTGERERYFILKQFRKHLVVFEKVLFLLNLILLLGCQHAITTQSLEAREAGKSPFPHLFLAT